MKNTYYTALSTHNLFEENYVPHWDITDFYVIADDQFEVFKALREVCPGSEFSIVSFESPLTRQTIANRADSPNPCTVRNVHRLSEFNFSR